MKERSGDSLSCPLTVIIPAKNEEVNLPAALKSVAFAAHVVVVDSGSADRTKEIALGLGAEVVQFEYDGGRVKKKNWALRQLSIETEWVLVLDADERITGTLADEIRSVIAARGVHAAYAIDREFVFMGRRLSCFRPNWNVRLFRRGRAEYEDLGLHNLAGTGDNEIHEHMVVNGSTGYLKSAMSHDDYRGLSPWFDRHNRYATWEAEIYRRFRQEPIGLTPSALLDPLRRKRILRRIWVRLPARPLLRFFVWYVLRGGWRDGKEGRLFCLLMGGYELLISAKIVEAELEDKKR